MAGLTVDFTRVAVTAGILAAILGLAYAIGRWTKYVLPSLLGSLVIAYCWLLAGVVLKR